MYVSRSSPVLPSYPEQIWKHLKVISFYCDFCLDLLTQECRGDVTSWIYFHISKHLPCAQVSSEHPEDQTVSFGINSFGTKWSEKRRLQLLPVESYLPSPSQAEQRRSEAQGIWPDLFFSLMPLSSHWPAAAAEKWAVKSNKRGNRLLSV